MADRAFVCRKNGERGPAELELGYSGLHAGLHGVALRAMGERKARTLLTLLAIILGVAVLLAVDVTRATTLASIRGLFDEISGRAQLVVQPAAAGSRGFDEALLQEVRRADAVEATAPLIRLKTSLLGEIAVRESPFAAGPQGGIDVFGVDPAVDGEVRDYALLRGRLLRAGDGDVALIGEQLTEGQRLSLGDNVQLVTPTGQLGLEIVGVVDRVGVGRSNGGRVVVAPLSVLQNAFLLRNKVTQIDVVVAPDVADHVGRLQAFRASLDGRLPRRVDVDFPATRSALVSQTLTTYQAGLDFFGVVSIFVGSFLIYNAFAMTVVERTREFGMLRAIGAGRRQIVRLILFEALILSLAGSLAGLLGGVALAGALIQGMGRLLSVSMDTFAVPPAGLVRSFALGVAVTLVAAFLPARQGGRISPLEALRLKARPDRASSWGQQRLAPGAILFAASLLLALAVDFLPQGAGTPLGVSAVLGILLGATLLVPPVMALLGGALRRGMIRLYGPAGWLGSSNMLRTRSRTALTVAALMVGVTMVIAFGEEVNSIRADLLHWVDTALGGDIYVRSINPMPSSFGRELQQTPGVAAVTPTTFITTDLVAPAEGEDPDPVNVRAIDPATYGQVGSFKFDEPREEQAASVARLDEGATVFVSTTLADRYGLRPGDEIVIETDDGATAFLVAAVVVDFGAQGNMITIGRSTLERYFGRQRVNRFVLNAAPGIDVATLVAEIEARYGKSRHVAVESGAAIQERLSRLMDRNLALLYALVAIALVVSALGVVNTLMMNVLERRREIGVLLSLGMTRHQVTRMVLAESASMGVVGSLFGLGLGLLLSRLLIKGANIAGGYRFAYTFSAIPVVLGVALGLIISQLAALYPARRATATNIVEAIKHE